MHLSIFKMVNQKLYLTFVMFIAVANHTLAQQPQSETRKFGLGVNASPDLCYRWLYNNDKSATSQMLIDSRNAGENPRIAYTLGVFGQLELRPNRKFEVGLQYSKMGYVSGTIFIGDNISGGLVTPTPSHSSNKVIRRFSIINDFTYLELPISMVFERHYASYSMFTRVGLVPSYLVSSTIYQKFIFADGSRDKTTPVESLNTFKNVSLSSIVSFGTAYELRNQFKIRVETNFKYGLMNIINTPVTARLWSSGINVSFIKSF